MMPNCGIKDVNPWAFPWTAGSSYKFGPESFDQYVLKGSFRVLAHALLEAKVAAGWHGDILTQLCGKLEN